MGKIVKYCAACEESFAEKFAFCPNCGQQMTAFEMSPVAAPVPVSEEAKAPAAIVEDFKVEEPAPIAFEVAPEIEASPVTEAATVSAAQTQTFSEDLIEEDVEEIEPEYEPSATKTFAAAAGANGNNHQTANYNYQAAPDARTYGSDDAFSVTV
jgi:hypothetical protein